MDSTNELDPGGETFQTQGQLGEAPALTGSVRNRFAEEMKRDVPGRGRDAGAASLPARNLLVCCDRQHPVLLTDS